MTKLEDRKEINLLALLFGATYMISYITRINYGAVISQMVIDTGIAKSLLSLAVTGSFITYGAGQIISGIMGDKFSPKKLVSCGLITTCTMNMLIPFCKGPYQMLVVWCINGFAQAFMWPPVVRLMSALLNEDDYKKVTVKVVWGSSFGTIAIYLAAPVLISLFNWQSVFIVSSVLGIIMLLIWNKKAYDIEAGSRPAEAPSKKVQSGSLKIFFTPLMGAILLAIVMQGMLRDGITTWMPSYITETFNLSNVISILTGVILPIFSIFSFKLCELLYRKKFKNPIKCSALIFGFGALSALVLCLFPNSNVVLSVLFSGLLTACMHGVNLLLVCMLPAYFEKYGNVSTASGVLNSFTYIGSAASTYAIAVLSERFGWSFTLTIWFIIAVAGTLLCLASIKGWNRSFGR